MSKLEELEAANKARLEALRQHAQSRQAGNFLSQYKPTTAIGMGADFVESPCTPVRNEARPHAEAEARFSTAHKQSAARTSSLHARRTQIQRELKALAIL